MDEMEGCVSENEMVPWNGENCVNGSVATEHHPPTYQKMSNFTSYLVGQKVVHILLLDNEHAERKDCNITDLSKTVVWSQILWTTSRHANRYAILRNLCHQFL